jgi:diadenosine tetraphosphate (Ap4A) HIT family hydrolase
LLAEYPQANRSSVLNRWTGSGDTRGLSAVDTLRFVSDETRRRGEHLISAARAAAAENPDGRLELPDVTTWAIFPFEGSLKVKALDDLSLPEPPRAGAGGVDCRACESGVADALWTDGRWLVRAPHAPEALPSVYLEPVDHLDLTDLDEEAAAQLGRLIVGVARALETLPGVGRVHVNRWGDGSEHLHVWIVARPAGVLQLRGSSLPDWIDVLPPLSRDLWDADLDALRTLLVSLPRS